MHLTNQTVASTKKRSTKKAPKLTEAQLLLQELDSQELRGWLHQFFTVNKEAEIQFLLEFSKRNTSYELADIAPLITTAFTSVIAKRKKIELNELKKIIPYLEQSLAPVFQYLQTIITDPKAFLLLEQIIETIHGKYRLHTVPGTRLQKYEGQLIDRFSLLLNNTQQVSEWQKPIDFLLHQLFEMDFGKVPFLLIRTISCLNKNGTKEQKTYIATQIAHRLQKFIAEDYSFRIEINQELLGILIESNQFKECHEYFTPYPYENEFNILFLNALKTVNAEETLVYCYELMSYNTKVDYNVPYLKIIEELLTADATSQKELAGVKRDLFVLEPDFERYEFVMNHLGDPTYLSKFRTNTLARLRHQFDENDHSKVLYLQILDREKDYKKMLEVMKVTPMAFGVLEPYLNKLTVLDKEAMLSGLSNHIVFSLIQNKPIEQAQEIHAFAQTHFTKQEINFFVESFWKRFFSYYPERIRKDFFAFF